MQRLLCVVSLAAASNVTPVSKVVQMLETMKEKGGKEMQEEQLQYAKYKQFCALTLSEKGRSISSASDEIESLAAGIAQAASEVSRLGEEIEGHLKEAQALEKEKANATALREKGREDFATSFKDYTESIDAIGRALKVLKEKEKSSALLELRSVRRLRRLPSEAVHGIDALSSLLEGPEPKTYDFQSGNVLQMLEGLQDKFVDERSSLEKEEQAERHSYELLVQSLEAQVTQAKKEQTEKSQFKAKKVESKAGASADLEETKTQKAADEKYFADLKANCDKKATAFEERQRLRGEELEAIAKAQAVIEGEAVSGMAEKHLPSLLQRTSLAFLRSDGARADVAKFLQERAQQLNSRVLSAAAVRAGADPMAKVRAMIEQLIVKMKDQAKEEATKRGWCDAELASNKATLEEKGSAVEGLRADVDELSAGISKLGEELVTLKKELLELDEAMANATSLRQKEKEKNGVTVADAKGAQEAVAQALSILKDFYTKAGAASLLQSSKAPEVFSDEPYTGMEGGGVMGMLEVIASDFGRLQAETVASEAAAKAEFEEFMEDSKVDKATKSKMVDTKANKKQTKSQELLTTEADLQGTTKELEAAEAYLEKLRPDCLDTGASYAERQAQRKEELKDLETALNMLENI